MPVQVGFAENMRAAVYMMVSMAGFTCNDAFLKSLAGALPLFQAVFLRGMIATLLIACLAWHQGALRFRAGRRDRKLIGQRTIGEIGGTVCFLTALFNMPIANASAILQSVPLAVTLGAALFLGEPVGWRRYLAIGVGFLGVLIIVRPGSEGFNAYALWAVAAIGFIVLRDLSTRSLSPDVPGVGVVLIASAALTTAAGIASTLDGWQPVGAGHVLRLCIAAVCLIVGYTFGVMTMRIGEIGFVAPFRYTLIIWAIFFGILMFGEWPDVWMLAGSAVVVASGLYTFQRERRLARAALSGVSSR
jgi:drug/metabolite transporter (DMT)-like permease